MCQPSAMRRCAHLHTCTPSQQSTSQSRKHTTAQQATAALLAATGHLALLTTQCRYLDANTALHPQPFQAVQYRRQHSDSHCTQHHHSALAALLRAVTTRTAAALVAALAYILTVVCSMHPSQQHPHHKHSTALVLLPCALKVVGSRLWVLGSRFQQMKVQSCMAVEQSPQHST
jgi:hypothetical protein